MKKKIWLVLLVVFMVGVLALSVFACNKPAGNDDDDDKGDEKTICKECEENEAEKGEYCLDCFGSLKSDSLEEMLGSLVPSIDNALKPAANITDAASVTASIFVDVKVNEELYQVKLDIAGSIDEGISANNWAQIDAYILGVDVSIFAAEVGGKEYLYLGQNIVDGTKTWTKLDQVSDDKLLSETVCGAIIGLLEGLSEDDKGKIEAGLLTSLLGETIGDTIASVGSLAGGLFAPTTDTPSFKTADGYATILDLSQVGGLLPMLAGIEGLAPYKGLIATVGGVLLGGTLDENLTTFTPGEYPPEISLAIDMNGDVFTGLALGYKGTFEDEETEELTNVSVSFGLKDIVISNESMEYDLPFTGTPSDFALRLDLGATLPSGLLESKEVEAWLEIYPVVTVDISNVTSLDDLYNIAIDVTNVKAVAQAKVGTNTYTIAEYNTTMSGDPATADEDILLDLTILNELFETDYFTEENSYYAIPLNLTEKLNGWLDSMKPVVEENFEEANAGEEPFNAINYIYGLVSDIIAGADPIGTIMGAAGKLGDIIGQLAPLFTEDVFAITEGEAEGKVTLNVEALMNKLLGTNGLITGINAEWNAFGLYNATTGEKETLTLAEILASEDVYSNIIALVNTIKYENYVKGLAEGVTADSYLTWAQANKFDDSVVDQIFTALGVDQNKTNLYKDLTLSVGGYAQDGIGFGFGIGVGDEALELSIGLDIIDRVDNYEGTLDFTNKTVINTGATYIEGEGEDAVTYKGIDKLVEVLKGALNAWLAENNVELTI